MFPSNEVGLSWARLQSSKSSGDNPPPKKKTKTKDDDDDDATSPLESCHPRGSPRKNIVRVETTVF